MLDEVKWLEQLGHDVAHFSTTHPENDSSAWSSYFTPYIELGTGGHLSTTDKMRAVRNMFYNSDAVSRFTRLLDDFMPDVIHIHNIHRHISPSILMVARARTIPVVQTLHDFHHVCSCDVLLRGGTQACQPRECGRLWNGPAVRNRCARGSLSVSTLAAVETSYARLARAYERGVTRFISPSRFLAGVMSEAGWRIPTDIVPNSVPLEERRDDAGVGFAVIGRLSEEKGVNIALQAARRLGIELTIAGDGPAGAQLRAEFPEAHFMGHLSGAEVTAIIRRSRAVLVPSLCLENAPMAVLETMTNGVPVIASRIGGIPEQVADGSNGVLVEAGDVAALARAISTLGEDPSYAIQLGMAARETIRTRFSPESHIRSLLSSYQSAIQAHEIAFGRETGAHIGV